MTQLALLEALANELHEAIKRYGDAIPLASAIGVLEIVKLELILSEREDEDDGS